MDRSSEIRVAGRAGRFLAHPPRQATNVTGLTIAAPIAVVLATPALAQVIETPNATTVVVPPGAPGVITRHPGSTGDQDAFTYSPTGHAADGIEADWAAAGNEGQPSRAGSTGSGGRGGNGGG
jgi:hypothetical protein